jgi:aminopeptidase
MRKWISDTISTVQPDAPAQNRLRPETGERVAILIDLPDPRGVKDFAFLQRQEPDHPALAHDVFYRVEKGRPEELGLDGGDLFAYQITGGSNLDLPGAAFDPAGREFSLEKEIYPNYNIILCISTFSATAPLTAFARKYGFRGATLHGLNEIILRTGLSVDYNEVSRDAEKLRLGLTRADRFEIDFEVLGQKHR